jgi:hypothetical protein
MVAVKKAEEGDRPNIPRDLDVRLQNLMKDCWDDDANLRPRSQKFWRFCRSTAKKSFIKTRTISPTAPPELDFECACAILNLCQVLLFFVISYQFLSFLL